MHTGLDRLAALDPLVSVLRRSRVALLAHPASVDRNLVHVAHRLRALDIRPIRIFGPEHGYGGEAQDMVGVEDARDIYGTPVRSLYGSRFEQLQPSREDLADIDVLLIDLQDIGSRYYTFVWTALLAARACAQIGIRVIVLDRPNPIGSRESEIEGRSQGAAYRSFVGLESIPVRHGLTLGEVLAWRANIEKFSKESLTIVASADSGGDARDWDRPFVMTSPNMPTYETALVYPGGCLIEGTNLSEGRGTTRPFELIGAPFLDSSRFAAELNDLKLPGCRFRPTNFIPMFHKHAAHVCGGVQVHVIDREAFRPVLTYVSLVAVAHAQSPHQFQFRTEAYEFVNDIPAFDLLTGDNEARIRIERGDPPREIGLAISELRTADKEIFRIAKKAARDWIV